MYHLILVPETVAFPVGKLVKLEAVKAYSTKTAATREVADLTAVSYVLPAEFSANIKPFINVLAVVVTVPVVSTFDVKPVKLATPNPADVPPFLIVSAAAVY